MTAKGKYPDEKCLMIGDAPGDQKAAKNNSFLFYPINPGHEEDSWNRFHEEAIDRFLAGEARKVRPALAVSPFTIRTTERRRRRWPTNGTTVSIRLLAECWD